MTRSLSEWCKLEEAQVLKRVVIAEVDQVPRESAFVRGRSSLFCLHYDNTSGQRIYILALQHAWPFLTDSRSPVSGHAYAYSYYKLLTRFRFLPTSLEIPVRAKDIRQRVLRV